MTSIFLIDFPSYRSYFSWTKASHGNYSIWNTFLVSRHHGYSIEGPPEAPHTSQHYCIEGLALSQVRICRPLPQFCSHFHERCTMCWIERKIIFPNFIFSCGRFCTQNSQNLLSLLTLIINQKRQFFSFVSKDVQCFETNA